MHSLLHHLKGYVQKNMQLIDNFILINQDKNTLGKSMDAVDNAACLLYG